MKDLKDLKGFQVFFLILNLIVKNFAQLKGKTGTAQKYENGRIAAGKYVSSFVGFFPADNPKYLALVIVDEPKGAYYGSVVATPVAGEIFQGIIDLKNMQPSY